MMPKISVIIPAYNTPMYILDRSLSSVFKQDFEDYYGEEYSGKQIKIWIEKVGSLWKKKIKKQSLQ